VYFIRIVDLKKATICKGKIADQITSIAWAPYGIDTEERKLGIIITGLNSGSISFWNPNDMVKGKDLSPDKLLNLGNLGTHSIDAQHQPIKCLAVNPYKPNLVVSGGSAVLIHNMDKGFKTLESYSPSQTSTEFSFTTDVGWNYKVPHIFASASENGTTVVWDLKNKKSIMNLTDQNFNLDVFSTEAVQYFL